MASKQFSVRLPGDLKDDVDDYAERHDISSGESLVRFANRGKQAFGYAGDGPTAIQEVARQMFNFGFILGLAFLLLTFIVGLPFLYAASAAFFVVSMLSLGVDRVEPALTENWRESRGDRADVDASEA